ncbi:MAG: glycosyltransferase family 4 protein [Bacteroidota bacterium]
MPAKRTTIMLTANSTWNLMHYRRPWIKALLGAGYRLVTASPIDKHREALEKLTGSVHLPLRKMAPRGTNVLSDLACVIELWHLYRNIQPDLAIHFTIKPNVYGGLAASFAGTRYMGVITGFGYAFLWGGTRRRLAIWLHQIGLRRAEKAVFYNPTDRDDFLRMRIVQPSQAVIIRGSGVDVAAFPRQPLPDVDKTVIRFLYLGRMLRDKGILELLEATKTLLARGVQLQLRLVGSTEALNPSVLSKEDLQTYAGAEWKESSQVGVEQAAIQYFPPTQDVHSHLRWCHVFVLPSYREGLSRAGVEALASGRPVLLTDVPGCRELVATSSANGILVPPQDAQALAEGMASFISKSSEEWRFMAKQSRQLAEEKFAASQSAHAFLQLLQTAFQ